MRTPFHRTAESVGRRANAAEDLLATHAGISPTWTNDDAWGIQEAALSDAGAVSLAPGVMDEKVAGDYAVHEERANALTHGLAGIVAFAAVCYLLVLALQRGTVWHLVGCGVYGATLVSMYLASYLCHSANTLSSKHRWRLADHICIYLLIAGSYTPFLLTVLRGSVGWWVLALVWGGAALGIASKLCHSRRLGSMSILPYVLLGWLAIAVSQPIVQALPWTGVAWLVAGGVFYTVGIRFFLQKSVPYSHTVWHLFVIAGSACHFCAVFCHVLP